MVVDYTTDHQRFYLEYMANLVADLNRYNSTDTLDVYTIRLLCHSSDMLLG